MSQKLEVSNIVFTNESSIDDLIKDYGNFIANKLKEMTYVKSLNYDDNYKEKEITKLIKQNKKNRLKSKFKKVNVKMHINVSLMVDMPL